MTGVCVSAALVVPAAGFVHQTGGVQLAQSGGGGCGIELPPSLVEGDPAANAEEEVNGLFTYSYRAELNRRPLPSGRSTQPWPQNFQTDKRNLLLINSKTPAPLRLGSRAGVIFYCRGISSEIDRLIRDIGGTGTGPPLRCRSRRQRPARAWSEWGLPAHTPAPRTAPRCAPYVRSADRAAASAAMPSATPACGSSVMPRYFWILVLQWVMRQLP